MMKKAGLWCLFLLNALSLAYGQITVTNSVFPAVGDTLYYAIDNAPNGIIITPPGFAQQWDFTGLKKTATVQEVYRDAREGSAFASFPSATLVYQPVAGGPEAYLQVTPQQVATLGYSGNNPVVAGLELVVTNKPPLVEARAPVQFFDIKQTSASVLVAFPADQLPGLEQLPIRPDSIRLRQAINRLDAVDAWGTLSIPGGQFEVLREKRTRYTESRIDAKIQPLGWLDVTDIVIQTFGLTTLGVDTTIVYRFINDVSKEPIAVCATDRSGLNVVNVQYKDTDVATGLDRYAQTGDLEVFPNPAGSFLNIKGDRWTDGLYQIRLHSMLGQPVLIRDLLVNGGNLDVSADLSAMIPGLYVCQIYRSGQLMASRTFVRE